MAKGRDKEIKARITVEGADDAVKKVRKVKAAIDSLSLPADSASKGTDRFGTNLDHIIVKSAKQVQELHRRLQALGNIPIGIDVETFENDIKAIAIASQKLPTAVIDTSKMTPAMSSAINKIFADPKIPKAIHHALFEIMQTSLKGLKLDISSIIDTEKVSDQLRAIYEEAGKNHNLGRASNLKDLSRTVLGKQMDKTLQSEDNWKQGLKGDPAKAAYVAQDAQAALSLMANAEKLATEVSHNLKDIATGVLKEIIPVANAAVEAAKKTKVAQQIAATQGIKLTGKTDPAVFSGKEADIKASRAQLDNTLNDFAYLQNALKSIEKDFGTDQARKIQSNLIGNLIGNNLREKGERDLKSSDLITKKRGNDALAKHTGALVDLDDLFQNLHRAANTTAHDDIDHLETYMDAIIASGRKLKNLSMVSTDLKGSPLQSSLTAAGHALKDVNLEDTDVSKIEKFVPALSAVSQVIKDINKITSDTFNDVVNAEQSGDIFRSLQAKRIRNKRLADYGNEKDKNISEMTDLEKSNFAYNSKSAPIKMAHLQEETAKDMVQRHLFNFKEIEPLLNNLPKGQMASAMTKAGLPKELQQSIENIINHTTSFLKKELDNGANNPDVVKAAGTQRLVKAVSDRAGTLSQYMLDPIVKSLSTNIDRAKAMIASDTGAKYHPDTLTAANKYVQDAQDNLANYLLRKIVAAGAGALDTPEKADKFFKNSIEEFEPVLAKPQFLRKLTGDRKGRKISQANATGIDDINLRAMAEVLDKMYSKGGGEIVNAVAQQREVNRIFSSLKQKQTLLERNMSHAQDPAAVQQQLDNVAQQLTQARSVLQYLEPYVKKENMASRAAERVSEHDTLFKQQTVVVKRLEYMFRELQRKAALGGSYAKDYMPAVQDQQSVLQTLKTALAKLQYQLTGKLPTPQDRKAEGVKYALKELGNRALGLNVLSTKYNDNPDRMPDAAEFKTDLGMAGAIAAKGKQSNLNAFIKKAQRDMQHIANPEELEKYVQQYTKEFAKLLNDSVDIVQKDINTVKRYAGKRVAGQLKERAGKGSQTQSLNHQIQQLAEELSSSDDETANESTRQQLADLVRKKKSIQGLSTGASDAQLLNKELKEMIGGKQEEKKHLQVISNLLRESGTRDIKSLASEERNYLEKFAKGRFDSVESLYSQSEAEIAHIRKQIDQDIKGLDSIIQKYDGVLRNKIITPRGALEQTLRDKTEELQRMVYSKMEKVPNTTKDVQAAFEELKKDDTFKSLANDVAALQLKLQATKDLVRSTISGEGTGKSGSNAPQDELSKLNQQIRNKKNEILEAYNSSAPNSSSRVASLRNELAIMERQKKALIGVDLAGQSHGRTFFGWMTKIAITLGSIRFLFEGIASVMSGLVTPGLEYVRTIEQARIGLTGILLSLTTINDEQMSMNRASIISADIIKKATDASLVLGIQSEDIIKLMQGLLSGGLGGGMGIEDVMQFSLTGASALKQMQMPHEQFLQELRDMVQGGIQPQSSVLATNLGITDADVNRWRSAGTLFENLMQRMQGFRQSANEHMNTLNGKIDILTEGFKRLMAAGLAPFYEKGKKWLTEIINAFMIIDVKTGKLTFKKEWVDRVEELGKGLEGVVETLIKVADILSKDFAVTASLSGIKGALGFIKDHIEAIIRLLELWIGAKIFKMGVAVFKSIWNVMKDLKLATTAVGSAIENAGKSSMAWDLLPFATPFFADAIRLVLKLFGKLGEALLDLKIKWKAFDFAAASGTLFRVVKDPRILAALLAVLGIGYAAKKGFDYLTDADNTNAPDYRNDPSRPSWADYRRQDEDPGMTERLRPKYVKIDMEAIESMRKAEKDYWLTRIKLAIDVANDEINYLKDQLDTAFDQYKVTIKDYYDKKLKFEQEILANNAKAIDADIQVIRENIRKRTGARGNSLASDFDPNKTYYTNPYGRDTGKLEGDYLKAFNYFAYTMQKLYGEIVQVTSTYEGGHSENSDHYKNRAIDYSFESIADKAAAQSSRGMELHIKADELAKTMGFAKSINETDPQYRHLGTGDAGHLAGLTGDWLEKAVGMTATKIGASSNNTSAILEEAGQFKDKIIAAAEKMGVSADLLAAVIKAESSFDPNAVSPRGAIGLSQLMPDTAAGLGVDPYDIGQNIMGGAMYLRQLADQFNGDVRLALAAYNAGPTAVSNFGGVPPYKETQEYVQKIEGYLAANSGSSFRDIISNKAAPKEAKVTLQEALNILKPFGIDERDINTKNGADLINLAKELVQKEQEKTKLDISNKSIQAKIAAERDKALMDVFKNMLKVKAENEHKMITEGNSSPGELGNSMMDAVKQVDFKAISNAWKSSKLTPSQMIESIAKGDSDPKNLPDKYKYTFRSMLVDYILENIRNIQNIDDNDEYAKIINKKFGASIIEQVLSDSENNIKEAIKQHSLRMDKMALDYANMGWKLEQSLYNKSREPVKGDPDFAEHQMQRFAKETNEPANFTAYYNAKKDNLAKYTSAIIRPEDIKEYLGEQKWRELTEQQRSNLSSIIMEQARPLQELINYRERIKSLTEANPNYAELSEGEKIIKMSNILSNINEVIKTEIAELEINLIALANKNPELAKDIAAIIETLRTGSRNIANQQKQVADNVKILGVSFSKAELKAPLEDAFTGFLTSLPAVIAGTKSVSQAFRDMAISIIDSMIKIVAQQIAKNLVMLILGASTGGEVDQPMVPGLATGGRVIQLNSISHRGPKFAGGGVTGVGSDTSDNIPVWVSPGEWVIRAKAARRYGTDFMRAVNEERLDPKAVRASKFALGGHVSALGGRYYVPRISRFAEGGVVNPNVVAAMAPQPNPAPEVNISMVALTDPKQMEQYIASTDGNKTLIKWANANQGILRKIIASK